MTTNEPNRVNGSNGTNGSHAVNGTNGAVKDEINRDQRKIIVVGAGPVGLFVALKLAQAGIPVDIIEKLDAQNEALRAAGFHGPLLLALKKAGLYERMEERGNLTNGLCWRFPPIPDGKGGKMQGEMITRLPILQPSEDGGPPGNGMLLFPQAKFVKLLVQDVLNTGLVNIIYDCEIWGIDDQGSHVRATVRSGKSGDTREIVGSYLIGADGGKSSTRKLLDIQFPGHTWPDRLLATEVILTNEKVAETPGGFVMDPIHFAATIPLTKAIEGQESLWRYTMAIDPADLRPDEDVLSDENIATMYERVMHGPRPLQYDLRRRAIYRVHQRCATTMRRGRCFLAGDAAHLNNPFGAMGLATGLLDAEALADSLTLVMNEKFPEIVLSMYSDERRRIFQFFVDPTSTQNKLRVASNPEYAAKEDWFLRMLQNPRPEAMQAYRKATFDTWRTDMRKLVGERGIKGQGQNY